MCTEVACASTCDYEGLTRVDGEKWEASDGCMRICLNGQVVQEAYTCTRTNSSSKFFVIGISLAAAIILVIFATVVAIIRNRRKAQEEARRMNGILLDDVNPDSDSDNYPSPSPSVNNNFGGFSQPTYVTTAMPQAFGSPVWGGQAMATTPMVLMTQTGEPVVVQVAYM